MPSPAWPIRAPAVVVPSLDPASSPIVRVMVSMFLDPLKPGVPASAFLSSSSSFSHVGGPGAGRYRALFPAAFPMTVLPLPNAASLVAAAVAIDFSLTVVAVLDASPPADS